MLAHLRALDVDIVTMDEVHQRLAERNFARRFACFTLDDGYRDNRDFALPVMREFDAPFTVYVTSDFAEGTGRLWWVALERVIAKASSIEVADRRRRDPPRYLDAGGQAGRLRPAARLAARAAGRARHAARNLARCARAMASTRRRSPASSACPGTN